MELESKKYQKRMIAIVVILIISTILGTIAEKEIRKKSQELDSTVETIRATSEEEYEKSREEKTAKTGKEYPTKEKLLSTLSEVQDYYHTFIDRQESIGILAFSIAFSGTFMGIMMYFIFTGWVLKKIWKDIKTWISVLMRILILIILVQLLAYPLILIGLVGQLPFVAYTLYKYIKVRKLEDKDDVIVEK